MLQETSNRLSAQGDCTAQSQLVRLANVVRIADVFVDGRGTSMEKLVNYLRIREAAEYLVALLNSRHFLMYARSNAIPAIGQANLSPSRYGDIHVPLPPIPEQTAIIAHLNERVSRSNTIEVSLRRSLDLLRERRSALITAAVTGQIPMEEMTK